MPRGQYTIIVPPAVLDSLIYGCVFSLMSLGLTLSYMTSKVPNFAHGSFITLGAYITYSQFRIQGLNPYLAAPFSFLIGGLMGLSMYFLLLRPLIKRGANTITCMVGTIAVGVAFTGFFGVLADYIAHVYKFPDARYFLLASSDFTIFGLRGIVLVAPVVLVVSVSLLYLFLSKTQFGVSMRAAVQNPSLAQLIGINTTFVYCVAWFLAGGFAALAGNLFVLRLPGNPSMGTDFTIAFFAASLLGGLSSIYGAVLGGMIVGVGEIIGSTYISQIVGIWFSTYSPAIPMVIMVIGLVFVPEGLASLNWGSFRRRKP
jgi:branched-chain amino acid transport system permease protein